MTTQVEMLERHFENYDDISNIEAQAVYKIRSLSRRICDLQDRGYNFKKEWKKDLTGQRYVRYFINRN
tara:strand:- start:1367 stop:1570 length:204 start_codon:yes stop_codon:yes gene_type:complete